MSNFQEETYTSTSLDTSLWKRLLSLLWLQKKHIILLYAFMISLAIGDLLFPLLNRFAIDEFIIGGRQLD